MCSLVDWESLLRGPRAPVLMVTIEMLLVVKIPSVFPKIPDAFCRFPPIKKVGTPNFYIESHEYDLVMSISQVYYPYTSVIIPDIIIKTQK